jgi:HIV Tat-specific factor 1
MTVKFRDPLSAQACIIVRYRPWTAFSDTTLNGLPQKMNDRFFAGRRIEATLYSGRQRFNRGGADAGNADGQGDEADKQRLDDFAKWLMTEGD